MADFEPAIGHRPAIISIEKFNRSQSILESRELDAD